MSSQRQLAAIMFTDIEGYTSIMQQDEKLAIDFRNDHREIFDSKTEEYNGTIVQYFGDGTLSIFKSSVEAVLCAIAMQTAFIEKKLPIRIGIHVGDIVYSEDDIIGDAVNVASRIESCAIPGSVLISDKVHDQIRSHTSIKSKFLDAYDLKNVETAMPIFAIANEGLIVPKREDIKGKLKEPIAQKRSAPSLKKIGAVFILIVGLLAIAYYSGFFSDKDASYDKSIAVLPFENLSVDDDSEIFRDGVTEDILTQLSKLKDLHVISRTSVIRYKNTEKTTPEIADELGVTYILEGSIQKYGDKVRVTAQLINAETDKHLWADNYDRTLTDIFGIQSEVSREIVNALQLNLSVDEKQNLATIPTHNIEAYQLFLRGRQEADKRNKESLEKSIQLYERAIDLDPKYAEVYAEVANSTFLLTYYAQADPTEATEKANAYLNKAEALNDRISRIYTVRGLVYNHTKQFEKAKEAYEKAIRLAPNDVTARHQYATFYYYTGQYEKQLEQAKIAYKLDPMSFATAISYFTALTYNQKFDEAESLLKNMEAISDENDEFLINRSYMRLYMAKKDFKQAIDPLKELIKSEPAYTRFLGYCYGKIGDTSLAYGIVDTLKRNDDTRFKNHRIAVVFAGLQEADSVFYYLDTVRNKTKLFDSDQLYYFDDLKTDSRYADLLVAHGIKKEK